MKKQTEKNENIIAETGQVDLYGIYSCENNRTLTMTPQRSAPELLIPIMKIWKELESSNHSNSLQKFPLIYSRCQIMEQSKSKHQSVQTKIQKYIVSQIQGIMVIFDFLALLLTF